MMHYTPRDPGRAPTRPGGRRWRTPVAVILILVGLALYSAGAATVADHLPENGVIEALFYLVAGLLWVYPAARLIAWCARDGVG